MVRKLLKFQTNLLNVLESAHCGMAKLVQGLPIQTANIASNYLLRDGGLLIRICVINGQFWYSRLYYYPRIMCAHVNVLFKKYHCKDVIPG